MNSISKKIILLIDKDLKASQQTAKILANDDWLLIVAKDSDTALKAVRQQNIDLILCAATAAKYQDYNLLIKLKENSQTEIVPLIILDRDLDLSVWRKVMSLGADDYLSKANIPEIRTAIAAQLQKQAAHRKRLEQQTQQLQDYIATTLPHELRAPLTSIIASSEFLITGEIETLDREIIHEMLECIRLSADRLNESIEKFLLYSQLQQASKDPQKIQNFRNSETTSLAELIANRAKKQVRKANRQADLQLQLEDVPVQMGTNNLGKMLEELIDNACKFSLPGTPISVKTTQEKDRLVIAIEDRGRGMTAQQINSIGPYIQFERQTHEQQGIGLGLAIAKRLAELHQGELSIESIPKRSTTAKIYLPKASKYSMLGLIS
ncbi:MAG: hybrid sensor histidine kinase/response regulator [Prochloraceae cyanobacterium]|nr:hybrid sensor histidine kinase/response regulator [Prochloraceae cyanobacterium]